MEATTSGRSRLLDGPARSQKGYRAPLTRPAKQERISQRRALHDFTRPLVVARELYASRDVCAAIQQELRHRQASIVELRHRMENCRLPADAGIIDRRASIDVRPAVEEQGDRCDAAKFRGHV